MKNEDKKEKEIKKGTNNKTKSTKKKTTNKGTVKKESVKKEVENQKVEKEVKEEKSTDRVIEVKEEKSAVKKNDLFLILGLVVVVIIGCIFMWGEKPVQDYELPLTLSGEAGLHQLTYQEYQDKIDNKEAFVIILERATCSHCVSFMPVAKEFAKDNGLPMYYVDTDTFSDEDWDGFEKSNSYLKEKNGNWGTPTTLVLAGNAAVDYIEGETSADSLLNLYKEYFDME